MNYFDNISTTYRDNKYIYIPVAVHLLITAVVYYYSGLATAVIFGISFALLISLIAIFHIYREIEKVLEDERLQNQSMQSLFHLLNLRLPLPQMTGWSAYPHLLKVIMEVILESKPKVVLEAGSGVSSLVTGYLLEKNKVGRCYSLDHDPAYGEKTTRQIQKHDLHSFCEVIHAPLKTYKIDGKDWVWYNINALDPDLRFDVLTIDGPPVKTQNHARYPALPLLYDRINDGGFIILDDAARESESEIIELWLKKYPDLKLDYRQSSKGVAILKKHKS